MTIPMNEYVTLGRSGLRVSPLCLGTMTFGTEWGWGSEEAAARDVFNLYIDSGGNFLDTADGYTLGHSEELLGRFIGERGLRERVVLATKFTMHTDPGNPNGGGNGRKNLYRALERSLERLRTDYVDLYWLHFWDTSTPIEEVVGTLNDLVHAGKIRYYGLSDTPAWYAARAYTMAQRDGWHRPIALQLEYSLIERNIEREHVPAAQELGWGICPWSPLGGGFLTGKYTRSGEGWAGEGRFQKMKDHPVYQKFTERNWHILDELLDASRRLGRSPAQVALNWAATQPGITSPIVGATKASQLKDTLASLEFEIPLELRDRLDAASRLEAIHPYLFYSPAMQTLAHGNLSIHGWMPVHATGAPSGVGAVSNVAKEETKDAVHEPAGARR